MSNIALRTLQRKIEEEITQKKVDSAIISCRTILETYPKNIATYRLLGKGFLESPNLDLANIIFDIILRVDPDDFVSHIGKSFVAESKGDLPRAVDSMERAFELQPANEVLQQEVKRLLKLMNGVDPNKVRLTRGSLIKMYLHGKLYSQAASEIRIGIHESPNRIDFKVNMAECLFNLDKPIQAVEICIDILASLPYCWKANQIIDDVISQDEDNANTNLNKSRLIELDPYYEYMLPSTNSVFDVPDISVLFESQIPTGEYSETDWKSLLESIWQVDQTILELPAFSEEISKNADIPTIEPSGNEFQAIPNSNKKDISPEQIGFNSKKERFISKFRSSPNSSDQEKDIPDWILDAGPADEKTLESHSLSQDEVFSDLKVNRQTEITDSPIDEIDSQSFHKEWHSEDLNSTDKNEGESQSLDDTQKISIEPDEIHERIQEAQKAVVGGNYQYSIQILRDLIKEKLDLKTVISALEKIIEDSPDQEDFKSLLGQAYLKCGRKEEANQIFLDIRNNLS